MAKVATTGLTVSGVPFGEDVRAGDLVGWSNGRLVRAFGGAGSPIPAVGVAAAAYKDGDTGALHLMGEVSGFVDLVEGDVQYLSITTPGDVQSTPPSGMGNLKQVVGCAVGPAAIVVRIEPATVL
ncbi:MAG: hypothetical protein ACM3US_00245 [Sphingomonadaceae bacterium]